MLWYWFNNICTCVIEDIVKIKKVCKANHTFWMYWLNLIYLRGKKGFNGDLNCCDIHGFVTGFQATEVGTGGRGRCNPNGNLAWGLST